MLEDQEHLVKSRVSSHTRWLRNTFIVGVVLVIAGAAFAQSRFRSLPEAFQWLRGETVLIEPTVIDLGDVEPGTRKELEVSLRNIGMKPVTVHGGIPGCACTTLFSSEFPLSIPAGRTSKLLLTIDFEESVLRDDIRFTVSYLTTANPVQVVILGKFKRDGGKKEI